MTWEERRLTDTTAEQTWAELTEMVARANQLPTPAKLTWPPTDRDAAWLRFTTRRAGGWYWRGTEGDRLGENTPVIARMGWQTDHGGRRHVHLAAGIHDTWGGHASWPLETLVYQPHGFFYEPAGAGSSLFLVVCGCGAIGTPEEIGWMGDRCGPCHDRTQEETTLPAWVSLRERNYPEHGFSRMGVPCAVSPDGERLLIAPRERTGSGRGREVLVWNLTHQRLDDELNVDDEVAGIAYTADGTRLVILTRVDQQGHLRIHDAATGRSLRVVDLPAPTPTALALSLDGTTAHIATYGTTAQSATFTGDRRTVSLEDATAPVLTKPTDLGVVHMQVISPDGRSLLAGVSRARQPSLTRCALDTGKIEARIPFSAYPAAIVWPDADVVGVVDPAGSLHLRDATTLAPLGRFHRRDLRVSSATLVGPWLVLVSEDPDAAAWWPWQPLWEYARSRRGAASA